MTPKRLTIADAYAAAGRGGPRARAAKAPPAAHANGKAAAIPSRGRQLSTSDVAQLAGISATTVRQHRRGGSMPPPDGELAGRWWWWETTIRPWLRERRGRGRPAGSSST